MSTDTARSLRGGLRRPELPGDSPAARQSLPFPRLYRCHIAATGSGLERTAFVRRVLMPSWRHSQGVERSGRPRAVQAG
jgi:hypothetical protein